jgi:phage protein D
MPSANGTSEQHVAGIDVRVAGSPLDPQFRNALTEVKVVDSLTLPDMALIRITDPQGEHVDSHPLQLGAEIEIKAAAMNDQTMTRIFKGQVAAVEPEFSRNGLTITVRAYDKAHKLNRQKKTRTWQDSTASNMVGKIAGENGFGKSKIQSTSVVHKFFQQSNESEWDFLWRLALMHDFEVHVDDNDLVFQPANKTAGAALELRWQDKLISFRPRVSGVQQPQTVNIRGWDPDSKAVVTGSAASATTSSSAGITRAQASNALGGGTTAIADRVVATAGEANALAQSTLNRMADAFYEADGLAFGNPAIAAGSKVKIAGVGQKFSGEFTVTSSTHTYRGATGYQTAFQISGRSSRTLLELIRPPQSRDWASSLVVGTVTNNKDDKNQGRVRVKFPSLSDTDESWWAPIAVPHAGKERGLLMLPQVGDEVIVGFEHGDARRPIVLGAVFNGQDTPGDELILAQKGALGVKSQDKIHLHSAKEFEIKSDDKMTVEVTKDVTETLKAKYTADVTGEYKVETKASGSLKAQTMTVEAGTAMTVKGVNVTVEASGSLTLKGMTVTIQGQTAVNVQGAIINLG